MANVVDAILCYLDRNVSANSLNLASELREDHQKIVGAIKSLQCLGTVIECEQVSGRRWELTEEGKQIAENGSHEALIYAAVPSTPNGISQTELMKAMPHSSVGFSKAMSSGWIAIDKTAAGGPRITRKVADIVDSVKESLLKIQNGQESDVTSEMKQEFKKRKLLKEVTVTSFDISQGPTFTTSVTKQETDLTAEMIATNSWQNKTFKAYNYDAMGIPPTRGHLHPLLKVRAEFRQIFLEMGFSEMPTNNYVESSFWNFDTLFQPQQHPARDAHDTFFLSEPKYSNDFPEEYLKRVRDTHQYGGYGSQGYKYDWKLEEAQKNLLRTHTTAVSARLLYKLAQQEKFTPVKYFSIDRVFRNETLDATHLAEFNQIEGVIADFNLTLGDLMGVLQAFFKKLGIAKIRFKPAYNPYTEPSMEIFSFHEGLNKWVEVGNSGVFRPEMLLPMGLPKDVSVIAWGLSLERPTMIKYGISNIRDLVGHKVNLQMVYDNPICRLDKVSDALKVTSDWRDVEAHQVRVLDTLQRIQQELVKLKEDLGFKGTEPIMDNTDIIIHASADRPPLSLIVLLNQLAHQNPVQLTSYVHSSVNSSTHSIVPKWEISQNNISSTLKNGPLKVTVIWKGSGHKCKMFNSLNRKSIHGEANVARYLARILNPRYDHNAEIGTIIDQFIDLGNNLIECNQAAQQNAVMKVLNAHLATRVWLVKDQLTLADIFMFSAFQYVSCNVLHNVKRWHDACKDHAIFANLR